MSPDFQRETEEAKSEREYRATHDRTGYYFPNPNRAQRRHIAASWKHHPPTDCGTVGAEPEGTNVTTTVHR